MPFVDLKAQYQSIKGEIQEAINRVLESSSYVLGEEVAAFEDEFAAYCGARSGIAVNSGTSALHLALLAAGIGPGDEVITVPFTFVATAAAILYAGSTSGLRRYRSLLLHHRCQSDRIRPLHHGPRPSCPSISMASQPTWTRFWRLLAAMGSSSSKMRRRRTGPNIKGKRVGGIGDLGCFSFYPAKNLGAYGEGGIVVTNNPEYDRTIRILRDWGQDTKYHHVLPGYNYRMDALQGAVLRVKLRYLDTWTDARRSHASRYDTQLVGARGAHLRRCHGHVMSTMSMPSERHLVTFYSNNSSARDPDGYSLPDPRPPATGIYATWGILPGPSHTPSAQPWKSYPCRCIQNYPR